VDTAYLWKMQQRAATSFDFCGWPVPGHLSSDFDSCRIWSSPDFVDTLNCTCVPVSGGYPNTTCPPGNATTALYAQDFFVTLKWIAHHAVFRSSISSYSVGVR
jgi:hypothetical protein